MPASPSRGSTGSLAAAAGMVWQAPYPDPAEDPRLPSSSSPGR